MIGARKLADMEEKIVGERMAEKQDMEGSNRIRKEGETSETSMEDYKKAGVWHEKEMKPHTITLSRSAFRTLPTACRDARC